MDRGVLTSHYIRVNLHYPPRAKSYPWLNFTFAAEILQTAHMSQIFADFLKALAFKKKQQQWIAGF